MTSVAKFCVYTFYINEQAPAIVAEYIRVGMLLVIDVITTWRVTVPVAYDDSSG
jgi:hypothetical protein